MFVWLKLVDELLCVMKGFAVVAAMPLLQYAMLVYTAVYAWGSAMLVHCSVCMGQCNVSLLQCNVGLLQCMQCWSTVVYWYILQCMRRG